MLFIRITSGGNIELRIDSIDGPVVGICPVAGSGGWQQWVDATCEVSGLNLPVAAVTCLI